METIGIGGFKITEIKYLPAMSGLFEIINNWYDKTGGVDFAWWTKKSIFYYPYLMVSYGGFLKETARENWRKDFNVGKDVYTMADSGGFQAVQRVISESQKTGIIEMEIPHVKLFKPKEVLKWQSNMNAGIILDQPPRGLQVERITQKHFEKCAEFTKQNIQEVEKEIRETPIDIYGVLQGITLKEIKTWWDIAVEPFNFDNLCFSPRVNKPTWLAVGLCFLNEKGIKNVHLLGLSSFRQQAFISYCKKLDFNKITYDSASFGKLTGYGSIYTPYLTKTLAGYNAQKSGLDMSNFYNICDCPVCTYARKYGKEYTKIDKEKHLLLDLHNLYHQIRFQEFCSWLADSREALIDFISQRKWKEVKEGIEFVDRYLEVGFDDAYGEIFSGREVGQRRLGGVS